MECRSGNGCGGTVFENRGILKTKTMKKRVGSCLIASAVCLSLCLLYNEEIYFIDAILITCIGVIVFFGLDMITSKD